MEKKQTVLTQKAVFWGILKRKWCLVIPLCIVVLSWQYSEMKTTSLRFLDQQGVEHILSLSVRDKKRLFRFMSALFAEDSFAYTLLGAKPVSWACYTKSFSFTKFSLLGDWLQRYDRTLHLGWEAWVKCRHLFPASSFWAESPRDNPKLCSILLINEQKFTDIVNRNKEDFQNVLQREILDGFQLLEEAKNRSLMHDVLQGHQVLLGIVLGYGRENSWEFLKRSEKRDPLSWVWEESEYNPAESGNSAIETNILLYSAPSFAGNPYSEESIQLKKEYLQTREKVLEYYRGKDFLEATLSLLAGFRP